MKAVSVRQLKSNPSAALRDARDQPAVRLALATALYKDASMSLGSAAWLSGRPLAEFMSHVSRLGIPVVREADAIREDVATLDRWMAEGDDL